MLSLRGIGSGGRKGEAAKTSNDATTTKSTTVTQTNQNPCRAAPSPTPILDSTWTGSLTAWCCWPRPCRTPRALSTAGCHLDKTQAWSLHPVIRCVWVQRFRVYDHRVYLLTSGSAGLLGFQADASPPAQREASISRPRYDANKGSWVLEPAVAQPSTGRTVEPKREVHPAAPETRQVRATLVHEAIGLLVC